jgi:hypothetical protein
MKESVNRDLEHTNDEQQTKLACLFSALWSIIWRSSTGGLGKRHFDENGIRTLLTM